MLLGFIIFFIKPFVFFGLHLAMLMQYKWLGWKIPLHILMLHYFDRNRFSFNVTQIRLFCTMVELHILNKVPHLQDQYTKVHPSLVGKWKLYAFECKMYSKNNMYCQSHYFHLFTCKAINVLIRCNICQSILLLLHICKIFLIVLHLFINRSATIHMYTLYILHAAANISMLRCKVCIRIHVTKENRSSLPLQINVYFLNLQKCSLYPIEHDKNYT